MAEPEAKRRKQNDTKDAAIGDTSKPTAIYKPKGGRKYTISIALPGSIVANAKSIDTKTSLAGRIARAAAVFSIDEVVIFNDGDSSGKKQLSSHASQDAVTGFTAYSDPDHFLTHMLSYLETPPHLRRKLFPEHPNLAKAGTLPSLDMPHHLRRDEWCRWREGIVTKAHPPTPGREPGSIKAGGWCLVDVGLEEEVRLPTCVPEGSRVTVDLGADRAPPDQSQDTVPVELGMGVPPLPAHPHAPREKDGYYWGYQVRKAASLSAVLEECTLDGGYDFCIGTSERGFPLTDFQSKWSKAEKPRWQHLLIIFGGVAGLEAAVANDSKLASSGLNDPADLFDAYINLLPGQGSRTIRTEEAIWIGCMGLHQWIESSQTTSK